jgi:hypothetical protein
LLMFPEFRPCGVLRNRRQVRLEANGSFPKRGDNPSAQLVYMKLSALVGSARHG